MRSFFVIVAIFALFACSSGGGTADSGNATANTMGNFSSPYQFDAVAQKGPLLQGSEISLSVYDADFNYVTRISSAAVLDDQGHFLFENLEGRYADITVRGSFQNELTGALSNYTTALTAYVDLSFYDNWSVNIVSTLAKSRVKYLIEEKDLAVIDAIHQAYSEVLLAYGIETDVDMATANVLEDDEAASILIAVSLVTLQLAVNEASYASGDIFEMNNFISDFKTDLKVDGIIGNTYGLAEKIRLAADGMNVTDARNNMESIKSTLGLTTAVPDFEQFIDFDGDGILFGYDDNTPSMTAPADVLHLDYEQTYTTDPIVVSGLHLLGYSWLETSWEVETKINGEYVSGQRFAVVNGDTLAFTDTSGRFGEVKTYSFSVGTETYNYSLTSYTPLTIVETNVDRGDLSPDGQTAYLKHANGFSVYDLSGGTSVKTGTWFGASITQDIQVNAEGTVAYLSSSAYGLYVVDISDPDSMTEIGHYLTDVSGTEHFVLDEDNDRLVISTDKLSWSAFDISADGTLANQVDVTTEKLTTGTAYSSTAGLYAVAADDYNETCSVYLYDVTDLSLVSEYICQDSKSTNIAEEVEFSHDGSKLLVMGGSAIEIVDLTTPSNPQLIVEKEIFLDHAVFSPDDENIFVATSGGFEIYSLANLPILSEEPDREYGYYPVENFDFTADGERMLVVKSSQQSYVLDLSDMVY